MQSTSYLTTSQTSQTTTSRRISVLSIPPQYSSSSSESYHHQGANTSAFTLRDSWSEGSTSYHLPPSYSSVALPLQNVDHANSHFDTVLYSSRSIPSSPLTTTSFSEQTERNFKIRRSSLAEVPEPIDRNRQRAHEYPIYLCNRAAGMFRIYSRTSDSPNEEITPFFIGNDDVMGDVEIQLTSPYAIDSIALNLRGRVLSNAYESGSYTFVKFTVPIWDRSSGDPRITESLEPQPSFKEKFQGSYLFDFSFPFPSRIEQSGRQKNNSSRFFSTPPSFVNKDINASVQYELTLNIVHGWFKFTERIRKVLQYLPKVLPGPIPLLRRIAYEEGTRLPGPAIDPAGWHSVGSSFVQGRMPSNLDVELSCTLYLAKPLAYTRGTVIPCYLHLSSWEPQIVQALAQPDVPYVRLCRRVRCNDTWQKSLSTRESTLEIQKAVWWNTSLDVQETNHDRYLEGEIHLSQNEEPTSKFFAFLIDYTVELMPPKCPLFIPHVPDNPVFSCAVEITSFDSKGPVPTCFCSWPVDFVEERKILPATFR